MIDRKDIDKLVAEVAEKSVRAIVGSNIKIQYGEHETTGSTGGVTSYVTFDEPFDDVPTVLVSARRPDGIAGYYVRLITSSGTEFGVRAFGPSATAYSVTASWIAIGTKI